MENFTEQETEVFEYLDGLRESGETNMYGAGPYVQGTFGIEKKEASALVAKWMKTFSVRHPNG